MTDRPPAPPPPVPQQATAAPGSGEVVVETSSDLHFVLAFRPNIHLPVYTLHPGMISNDRVFGGGGLRCATMGFGGRRYFGLDRQGQAAFGFPIAFRFDTHHAGVAHVEAFDRPEDAEVVPFQIPGLARGERSVSDPIFTVLRLSNAQATSAQQGRPANIASVAIFMHGIQSGVGGSSAARPPGFWSDLPHTSPERFADLFKDNVKASFEVLLFACLTAAEPETHTPGPRSYAYRLAEALRPHCAERVRVFGHLVAAHYAENRYGYEYVSENGGAVVQRSNREVCLPDAYLLDPARVARLAARTGQTEEYIRAHVVSSADAWMHGEGGGVRESTVDGERHSLGAAACYAIGYAREATIAVVQGAWESPAGAIARFTPPPARRGH